MRKVILQSLVLVLLLGSIAIPGLAQTSLGGLYPGDSLPRVFEVMDVPDAITAKRGDTQEEDVARLFYKNPYTTIRLTPEGDQLDYMFTGSPRVQTDDHLRVGSSRSDVVDKRGAPEEITSTAGNTTSYWYWSQGVVFAMDNDTNIVEAIGIFPPLKNVGEQISSIALLKGYANIERRLQPAGADQGRPGNTGISSMLDAYLGVTLRDSHNRIVNALSYGIGEIPLHAGVPQEFELPSNIGWSTYQISLRAPREAGLRSSAHSRSRAELMRRCASMVREYQPR